METLRFETTAEGLSCLIWWLKVNLNNFKTLFLVFQIAKTTLSWRFLHQFVSTAAVSGVVLSVSTRCHVLRGVSNPVLWPLGGSSAPGFPPPRSSKQQTELRSKRVRERPKPPLTATFKLFLQHCSGIQTEAE